MDSVVHFEMPYDDRDRMAKFYEDVFGWEPRKLGPEMNEYVVVTTTETGAAGPVNPGAINGGFFRRSPMGQYPGVVIAVNDIRVAMQKVNEAGGSVMGEPMMIPGIGDYVSFTDSEGNRVSLLQPLPRMGA